MWSFAPDEQDELVLRMPYAKNSGAPQAAPRPNAAPAPPAPGVRAETTDALSQVLLSDYLSSRDFRAMYEDARFASAGGQLDYTTHLLWGNTVPGMYGPRPGGVVGAAVSSTGVPTETGAPFVKNETLEDIQLPVYGAHPRDYTNVAPPTAGQSGPAVGEYGKDWAGGSNHKCVVRLYFQSSY